MSEPNQYAANRLVRERRRDAELSDWQPASGMWCIQGTVTISSDSGRTTISPQFATFYLHPEVNTSSVAGAIKTATGILNPSEDPNITPNVSAVLVNVGSVMDEDHQWTVGELRKMDPTVMSGD